MLKYTLLCFLFLYIATCISGQCIITLATKETRTVKYTTTCAVIDRFGGNTTGTYIASLLAFNEDALAQNTTYGSMIFTRLSIPYEKRLEDIIQAGGDQLSFIIFHQFLLSGLLNNIYHEGIDRSDFPVPVVDMATLNISPLLNIISESTEPLLLWLEIGEDHSNTLTAFTDAPISYFIQYIIIGTSACFTVMAIVKLIGFIMEKGFKIEHTSMMLLHFVLFGMVGVLEAIDFFFMRSLYAVSITMLLFMMNINCICIITLLNIVFIGQIFEDLSHRRTDYTFGSKGATVFVYIYIALLHITAFMDFILMHISLSLRLLVYLISIVVIGISFVVFFIRLTALYFTVAKVMRKMKGTSARKTNALYAIRFFLWFTPTCFIIIAMLSMLGFMQGDFFSAPISFYVTQMYSFLLYLVPYFVFLGSLRYTGKKSSSKSHLRSTKNGKLVSSKLNSIKSDTK